MVSDSLVNSPIAIVSKDFGKKKRANRTAKLKQCKLDARRDQWLSQVRKKGCKEDVSYNECVEEGEFNAPEFKTREKCSHRCKDLEMERHVEVDNDGSIHRESDSESPAISPTGSGNHSTNSYVGSSSSSGCSFSSGGSFSGSISEEEEGDGGDNDCLDDWEAMADALEAASGEKQGKNPAPDSSVAKETVTQLDSAPQYSNWEDVVTEFDKSKTASVGILTRSVETNRAWRADDAFRPQSLPNLSKQRSFPANGERYYGHRDNPWGRNIAVTAPISCPICCEDLDMTDSSFLPCPCGFRLCLFCHKRILEEDGRCPGCRKRYDLDPVKKETSVSGGCLTIRLARSRSMFSRA